MTRGKERISGNDENKGEDKNKDKQQEKSTGFTPDRESCRYPAITVIVNIYLFFLRANDECSLAATITPRAEQGIARKMNVSDQF